MLPPRHGTGNGRKHGPDLLSEWGLLVDGDVQLCSKFQDVRGVETVRLLCEGTEDERFDVGIGRVLVANSGRERCDTLALLVRTYSTESTIA
ncbi:hypothetical protein EGH21_21425 [Halomicroarcula sp. F13]|uniref:Uncharacterized protein n=1 Tax=Haloarcula rubra TaxID=2487747 RepID=A0AAW4PZP4_9EURY|nr:hypothetical protein [Halomicroarcula rubra]MBX0325589.1 hypothetical protein [Halomicroarcula rubra]